MNVLAIGLLLVIAFSLRLQFATIDKPARMLQALIIRHVCLTAAVLGAVILLYLGLGRAGSPLIPRAERLRMQHVGYYTRPELGITFRAVVQGAENTIEDGFRHSALSPGEMLRFQPVESSEPESRIGGWVVDAAASSQPLRIGGICRNLPEEWWLVDGDSLALVSLQGPLPRYLSFRLHRREDPNHPGKRLDDYEYSQGAWQDGRFVPDAGGAHISIPQPMLQNGRRLIDMLRATPEFRADWVRLTGQIPNLYQPAWEEVLHQLIWAREIERNPSSRMGTILPAHLLRTGRLAVFKNGRRLQPAGHTGPIQVQTSGGNSPLPVSYGLEARTALSFLLPLRPERETGIGPVLPLRFPKPASWHLPPAGNRDRFIVTSSDSYIPLFGYQIGEPNGKHAYHAVVSPSKDFRVFEVNTGYSRTPWRAGERHLLGDYDQGALVQIIDPEPSVPFSGRLALGLLVLHTGLFILVLRGQPHFFPRRRPPSRTSDALDVTWAHLWVGTLSLLCVRLILAYRCSLLPPDDASSSELVSVFQKSLHTSQLGLLIIPGLLLLVRLAAQSPLYWLRDGLLSLAEWGERMHARVAARFSENVADGCGTVLTFLSWVPCFTWIVLGAVGGSNESVGGFLRISHGAHLLLVLVFAAIAPTLLLRQPWWRVAHLLVATLLILGVMLGVGDIGSAIYLMSLAIMAGCLLFWGRVSARGIWRPGLGAGLLGGILLLLMLAPTALRIASPLYRGTPPSWPSPTFYYRLITFGRTEAAWLQGTGTGGEIKVDLMLRNSQQNWQMLHYAAQGRYAPTGYGRAPLSNAGMNYPTSLVDCTYATYLLSEHGMLVGWLVILLYVGIMAAIFLGIRLLPTSLGHRMVPLVLIGAFFGCNSLYMASANLGLVPFTGQNIPFLGLYSWGDLVQCAILLSMAVWLLRFDLRAVAAGRVRREPLAQQSARLSLLLVSAWSLVLLGRLLFLPGDYRNDHDFDPVMFTKLASRLPISENPDAVLQLDGVQLKRAYPSVQLMAIERYYLDQLNARPDKLSPKGGLYYLQGTSFRDGSASGYRVALNREYFRLVSPFRGNSLWTGAVTAASAGRNPTLSVLGRPFSLSLAATGHAGSISLTGNEAVLGNRSVLLRETDAPGAMLYAELKRSGDGLTLHVKHRSGAGKVLVNGEAADTDSKGQPLREMDILAIESGTHRRYNLVYLGLRAPVLAFAQWRNGRYQRVFPEGRTLPMLYSLCEAADNAGSRMPSELPLSIDLPLQRAVQSHLRRWAMRQRDFRSGDPLTGKRVGVTLIDAFDGGVLTLGSWPFAAPDDPDFERRVISASPLDQERLVSNHNFKSHVVGSTIKPLVFSAVATQYHRKFDLARMRVLGYGRVHDRVGHLKLERSYACETEPEIGMRDFLIRSRDWPELVIGFLGLTLDPNDWDQVSEAHGHPADVSLGGTQYALDFRRAKESPFTLNDLEKGGVARPRTEAMDRTLLFRGLKSLFNVGVTADRKALQFGITRQYLPTFANQYTGAEDHRYARNYQLLHAQPEPVDLRPYDWQSLRGHAVSFLLGGGPGQWNNVTMAECMARVATGRAVNASLEPGNRTFGSLPPPLNDSAWRNLHLIQPLCAVATSPAGTAYGLGSAVQPGYTAIFKTGTLEQAKGRDETETLMFVVGKMRNGSFIPGATVAGFLHLESAHKAKAPWRRVPFARPLVNEICRYLERRGGLP